MLMSQMMSGLLYVPFACRTMPVGAGQILPKLLMLQCQLCSTQHVPMQPTRPNAAPHATPRRPHARPTRLHAGLTPPGPNATPTPPGPLRCCTLDPRRPHSARPAPTPPPRPSNCSFASVTELPRRPHVPRTGAKG